MPPEGKGVDESAAEVEWFIWQVGGQMGWKMWGPRPVKDCWGKAMRTLLSLYGPVETGTFSADSMTFPLRRCTECIGIGKDGLLVSDLLSF